MKLNVDFVSQQQEPGQRPILNDCGPACLSAVTGAPFEKAGIMQMASDIFNEQWGEGGTWDGRKRELMKYGLTGHNAKKRAISIVKYDYWYRPGGYFFDCRRRAPRQHRGRLRAAISSNWA